MPTLLHGIPLRFVMHTPTVPRPVGTYVPEMYTSVRVYFIVPLYCIHIIFYVYEFVTYMILPYWKGVLPIFNCISQVYLYTAYTFNVYKFSVVRNVSVRVALCTYRIICVV